MDHTSNAKTKWQAATYGQPCRISQRVSRPRRVTISRSYANIDGDERIKAKSF